MKWAGDNITSLLLIASIVIVLFVGYEISAFWAEVLDFD